MRKRRWRSGLDVSSKWLPVLQLNLHARYQHRIFTPQQFNHVDPNSDPIKRLAPPGKIRGSKIEVQNTGSVIQALQENLRKSDTPACLHSR